MSGTSEQRFNEEWARLVKERGWTDWDAARRLQELRTIAHRSHRKFHGENGVTQIREELAVRLRENVRGVVLSFPEIAPLLGYRSHSSVMYAVRRRMGEPARRLKPVGMDAGK